MNSRKHMIFIKGEINIEEKILRVMKKSDLKLNEPQE